MWRAAGARAGLHDRFAESNALQPCKGARITTMPPNAPERDDERGRILRLRAAAKRARACRSPTRRSRMSGNNARSEEPDNYRQRMINNGLAFAACVILVAIGVWLATAIAEMRRNQDCVFVGPGELRTVECAPANPTR